MLVIMTDVLDFILKKGQDHPVRWCSQQSLDIEVIQCTISMCWNIIKIKILAGTYKSFKKKYWLKYMNFLQVTSKWGSIFEHI